MTYFKHRITNAVAEGLNSKIATVQKNAPAGSETVTTSRSLSTSTVADLTCIRFQ
ncbi:transposase [Undibacterium arcticum]